ncbi:MAG: hypothetical protein HKN60_10235 [Rhizobiales bacterium]|nr:hypothetical protein [Hyphomicrobiales bacterium]
MWDFDLSRTFAAMARTAPFIVFRMAVYFGIAIFYVIATGAGGAIGYGVTSFSDDGGGMGAFYGAMIGFAGASGILYFAREFILYHVKVAHIAMLVLIHDGKQAPEGRAQIGFAAAIVRERFAQSSMLFAIDQLIKGVLRILTGLLGTASVLIPIPGLQGVMRMVNAVIRMSLTYVDEVIVAHIIRTGTDNPWQTGREGLVLYAQNYGTMIKNAIWLSLFVWLITIVIFFVMLGPVIALMALFPGDLGVWAFATAFVFAWAFKAALVEPLAIYALMQVYFRTIEGQEPNVEWDQRLASASAKFRDLKDRAMDAVVGPRPADGT